MTTKTGGHPGTTWRVALKRKLRQVYTHGINEFGGKTSAGTSQPTPSFQREKGEKKQKNNFKSCWAPSTLMEHMRRDHALSLMAPSFIRGILSLEVDKWLVVTILQQSCGLCKGGVWDPNLWLGTSRDRYHNPVWCSGWPHQMPRLRQ